MTEADWLACDIPEALLDFVRSRGSWRKFRLFIVGCCRRFWPAITEEWQRQAVEIGERFADRQATDVEREAAFQAASRSAPLWLPAGQPLDRVALACRLCVGAKSGDNAKSVSLLAAGAAATVVCPDEPDRWKEHLRQELAEQAHLVRCIFGSPFRPVSWNRRHLTGTVLSLARGAYDERAFERLPILADALEEAGCIDPSVLGHFRSPAPHVRGCWALDLCLGLR